MWDSREIATAALHRAGLIKAQIKRKKEKLQTAALLVSCTVLAVCMIALPNLMSDPGSPIPAQASTTMPGDAAIGGYVLVGLLAFSLGVTVTLLLCLNWKERKK